MAGAAPGGPEVDHHHLAAEVLGPERAALQGLEFEIGLDLPGGARRPRLAVRAAEQHQGQGEGERERPLHNPPSIGHPRPRGYRPGRPARRLATTTRSSRAYSTAPLSRHRTYSLLVDVQHPVAAARRGEAA